MSHQTKVGELYDRLLDNEAEKLAADNLTIHKRLQFPNGEFTDTHDWILKQLDLPADAHILDAGCGIGGTLFALLGEKRTGIGITLSHNQVETARKQAARLGLANRCTFIQQSYDEPLNDRFDLIISIEALIHSPDLTTTMQNLARHLKPAGRLLIIEDIAADHLVPSPITEIWQQSWSIRSIYSQLDYFNAIQAAGLTITENHDFTPFVPAKRWPSWFVRVAWQLVQKIPSAKNRARDIFVGGWALESLYRSNSIRYRATILTSNKCISD